MIEVKCPNCTKKASLIGVKGLELLKGKKKISGLKKFCLKLSEIDMNDTKELNSYSVNIIFCNSKKHKLPLREYLNEKNKKEQLTRFNQIRIKWISCLECGNSKPTIIDKIIYYYSIQIEDRFLVAKNKEEFIKIYNTLKNKDKVHFRQWGQIGYPKVFWEKREKIMKKMEMRLNQNQ